MKTGDKIANVIIAVVFATLIGVGWYLMANNAQSVSCNDHTSMGPY